MTWQEAHVGIGISGEEGLQAARASDYAIAQVPTPTTTRAGTLPRSPTTAYP